MKLFSSITYEEKKILFIPLTFFLLIVLAEIIIILILNSGLMVYTLDDAYIHLALGENIIRGHYGVNLQEYSAPSSSILWAFILAPFAGIDFELYIPLIINVCSAVGTLFLFWLIIKSIFSKLSEDQKIYKIALLFFILLIIATNSIVLIFTGMEHSFQVFLTVLIIWGLINFIQKGQLSKWLIFAIILAPLIRYENLVLSFAALFFLFLYGYKKQALFSFILIIITIGGFSTFLLKLGLNPLPTSVYGKSKIISGDGSLYPLLQNLRTNIYSPRCTLLIICMFFLSFTILSHKKEKEERLFAVCIAVSILLHIIVGKPGRYIFYIWTASVLSILFLHREWLIRIITKNNLLKTVLVFSIIVAFISYKYIYGIFTVPIASNNIYEQQYQMHRFAVEYYKKSVAVNDLGYVSYKNDYYVMDLVGLASLEALNHRRTNNKSDWIDTISKKHNVEFAMVYDSWMRGIPQNWYKIADLYLGKMKISPSENIVSFYILSDNIKEKVILLLERFQHTLPQDVKLKIHE